MRKVIAPLIAYLLATTACSSASAVPQAQTVSGEVIDLACYMLDKGNTTNTHRGRGYDCAQACAREGFQVGLLTVDGKVYELGGGLAANKNAKLVPHLGHTVSITGALQNKDGLSMISSDALRMGTESASTR